MNKEKNTVDPKIKNDSSKRSRFAKLYAWYRKTCGLHKKLLFSLSFIFAFAFIRFARVLIKWKWLRQK